MIASKRRPLRIGNFLAPNMTPVYEAIAQHLSGQLGYPTELHTPTSYTQALDYFDICFICGLAYIELSSTGELEPIAAPVLLGRRFGGRPIYFSDVVVRRELNVQKFADLRGGTWSYNEPMSQSGYGITRYCLAQRGETASFFGNVIEAGSHERSIQMIVEGTVDASAIDCQVLAVACRENPELQSQLQIIESFGPSTIQPVTVARWLPNALKEDIQKVFLTLCRHQTMKQRLARGVIERFVAVDDASYHDLRSMKQVCRDAGVLELG